MKKILIGTALIAGLAVNSFAYQSPKGNIIGVCEKGVKNVIQETLTDSTLELIQLEQDAYDSKNSDTDKLMAGKILEGFYEAQVEACSKFHIGKNIGTNFEMSIKALNGVSYRFDSSLYCLNWNQYIKHIEQSNDKELQESFAVFVSRPLVQFVSDYENITKDSDEIMALALLDKLGLSEIEYKTQKWRVGTDKKGVYKNRLTQNFQAHLMAYDILQQGVKRHVEEIGFFDIDFQNFLAAILSNDTYAADQILKDFSEDAQAIIEKAEETCDMF